MPPPCPARPFALWPCQRLRCRAERPREEETQLMPHRILTPNTHSEETLEIAHDLIPAGYELVTAPHGRPEFWNLLKDTEFYIGGGQFQHGPELYHHEP